MVETVPDKVREMFQKRIGLNRLGEPEGKKKKKKNKNKPEKKLVAPYFNGGS